MSFGLPRNPKDAAQKSRISPMRSPRLTSPSPYSPPPRRDVQERMWRYAQSIRKRQPPSEGIFSHSGPARPKPPPHVAAQPVQHIIAPPPPLLVDVNGLDRAQASGTSDEADDERISNPYIRSVLRGAEQRWIPPSLAQAPPDYSARSQSVAQYNREAAPYLTRLDLVREWQKKKRKMQDSLDREGSLAPLLDHQIDNRDENNCVNNARHEGFCPKSPRDVLSQPLAAVPAPLLRARDDGQSSPELLKKYLQHLQRLEQQQQQEQQQEEEEEEGHCEKRAVVNAASAIAQTYQTYLLAAAASGASMSASAKAMPGTTRGPGGPHAYPHTPAYKKNEMEDGDEDEDERDPRAYLYSPSRENPLFCRTGALVPARCRQRFGVCEARAAPPVVVRCSAPHPNGSVHAHANDNEDEMVPNFLVGPGTEVVGSDELWIAEAEAPSFDVHLVARAPVRNW